MLDKDQWLSSILGKSVFQIDSKLVSQIAEYHLPQDPALVMVKVPVGNVYDCSHLQRLNFFLVDTNVQLQKLSDKSSLLANNLDVRFSKSSDQDAVLKIAANSFIHDRFHNDPDITQEAAEKIKVEWAKNYFMNARGDWMVVAEEGGVISGFLQLLRGVDGALIIDLIAVDQNYRNTGAAQKMISFAMQYCDTRTKVVRVGTQLANIPSISLYLKMGFTVISASYVFHRHI
jgi:ribosomal protein S18 acetylase RimI-like enzyme